MDIVDLLNKYGAPPSIKVGDHVIVEGFNNYGIYIVLCEVVKIDADLVDVKEIKKYFLTGNPLKCSGKIKTYSLEDLKKPIKARLIEQNDFVKWLTNDINNN